LPGVAMQWGERALELLDTYIHGFSMSCMTFSLWSFPLSFFTGSWLYRRLLGYNCCQDTNWARDRWFPPILFDSKDKAKQFKKASLF